MEAPRIPAAYYLALPVLLLFCAGLTIGLTYAKCYTTLCVETFFPYTTRIHLALFYSLLASVGLTLLARAHSKPVKAIFGLYLTDKPLPWTSTRVSVGGVILIVWIAGLVLGSTGYWLPVQHAFWFARGTASRWTDYTFRITWTGVTGHWCDLLFGLVVIPVGRNSVLARVFGLHSHGLLRAHQLLAYALLIGGIIHGLLYYSFLAAWIAKLNNKNTPPRLVGLIFTSYEPDNPTITHAQTKEMGKFLLANLPLGSASGLCLIPIMAITALPILRRISYNIFYFTHIVIAIVLMVILSLHASTNFYCLLPGLLLWVGDWAWRIVNSLSRKVDVRVCHAGGGWYRIIIDSNNAASARQADSERQSVVSAPAPLQHYYINIGKVSKIQGHPFTVAATASSGNEQTLLFRRSPERKKTKSRNREWTWQLAALADESESEKGILLPARIEGPYKPNVDDLYEADHVLAIAGGTGITGAISIANWWADQHGGDSTKSLTLVWTVRSQDVSDLDEFVKFQDRVADLKSMQVRCHVSTDSGRLSTDAVLSTFFEERKSESGKCWVYGSGPSDMLSDIEGACIRRRKGASKASLEWHLTRY